MLTEGSVVWLDGGHNPDAGTAIAKALENAPSVHVICGMLKNKDAIGFLKPFSHKIASLHAVPIPGHEHHDPKDLCWWVQDDLKIIDACPSENVTASMKALAAETGATSILICGSLYLAGEVLRANNEEPI